MADDNRDNRNDDNVELDDNGNDDVDKDKGDGADNETRSNNYSNNEIKIKLIYSLLISAPFQSSLLSPKILCLHPFFRKKLF